MRCLVTGAGGFAGAYLVRHLREAGDDVVAVRRGERPDALPPGVAAYDVDLRKSSDVAAVVREVAPDVVYHLAALTNVADCEKRRTDAVDVNVGGTIALIESVLAHAPRARILFVSSGQAYRPSAAPIAESALLEPESFYGLTKRWAEEAAHYLGRRGAHVVIARPFNHTGAGQRTDFALPSFARQIAEAEKKLREPRVRVGNLHPVRDFLHVRDVVAAYRVLAAEGRDGEVYNVCSGEGRTIGGALEALIQKARVPVQIDVDPARLRSHEVNAVVGSPAKIRRETAWRPAVAFDAVLDDLLEDARRLC